MARYTSGILALLKSYYLKEGVSNLLYRNDPLLNMIKKELVEGKQFNYSAAYSAGGAVAGDWLVAKEKAQRDIGAREFQITPGQLFSCCLFGTPEILASKTQAGAYAPIAGLKVDLALEALRKVLAHSLYSDGYGVLYEVDSAGLTIPAGADFELENVPLSACSALSPNMDIEFKTAKNATTALVSATVVSVDESAKKVVINSTAGGSVAGGSVACIAGMTRSNGDPLAPIGLAGWLPTESPAAGDSFYGIDRTVAPTRLAGQRIIRDSASDETIANAIERALMACRNAGGIPDTVVMSSEDFQTLAAEIQKETYFMRTQGTESGLAASTAGLASLGFAMQDNWVNHVIDTPYCPKGTAYLIDSNNLSMLSYTNSDKIADGTQTINKAGKKQEFTGENDFSTLPNQLLIDRLFTIQSGEGSTDGAASLVTANFFGAFCVYNTANCAVVTL